MTENKLQNFSTWSLKELIDKERSFPAGHLIGRELRAEIDRRLSLQKKRTASINRIAMVLSAVAAIFSIVYALDRGVFIGSVTNAEDDGFYVHKTCRYLFATGIAELPARGGIKDLPGTAFVQPYPPSASSLHCRFFGD